MNEASELQRTCVLHMNGIVGLGHASGYDLAMPWLSPIMETSDCVMVLAWSQPLHRQEKS